MKTEVWFNEANGHHFSMGEGGAAINGKPTIVVPEWVGERSPDMIFGALQDWSGGECPLDPGTLVRCVFRGRRPYVGPAIYPAMPERAKVAMWQHAPCEGRSDTAMDIVGYQVRLA
jgi:hypothetical protein